MLDSHAMAMLSADPLPLVMDEAGVIRIGGTRVSLDSLLASYLQGASVDELTAGFPDLALHEIHASIAYYHRHRDEIEEYLASRRREAETIEARIRDEFPEAYRRPSSSR
jgi:uncharacterized protein (DUF433 family)